VVVWQDEASGDAGELAVFFGSGGEALPVRLPRALSLSRCARELQLVRVAPELVMVEVRAECEGRKEQWLAVVRVGGGERREAEKRLELRASEPLRLALRVEDRDADGRPDLLLGARHAGAAEGELELPLVLLDRPAGYAWDPSEPGATLEREARAFREKRDPLAIEAKARRTLELAVAVCGELGATAIETHVGQARCGPPAVLADAVASLGLAALARGDLARAVLVSDRLEKLDPKGGARSGLDQALAERIPLVTPVARTLASRPRSGLDPLAPHTFDVEGALLVSEDRRVIRVDLGTREEGPSEALPWPRALVWGATDATIELLGVERTCTRSEDAFETRARGGRGRTQVPSLGALLERVVDGGCTSRALRPTAVLVDATSAWVAVAGEPFALAWGADGLAVRPAPLPGPSAVPGIPGAARSADGQVTALATPTSVLVVRGDEATRWKSEATRGLSACVPRSDGKKVACVGGEGVVVLGTDG
jgi:hypothetical protein